jgi:hypothetical protein
MIIMMIIMMMLSMATAKAGGDRHYSCPMMQQAASEFARRTVKMHAVKMAEW